MTVQLPTLIETCASSEMFPIRPPTRRCGPIEDGNRRLPAKRGNKAEEPGWTNHMQDNRLHSKAQRVDRAEGNDSRKQAGTSV